MRRVLARAAVPTGLALSLSLTPGCAPAPQPRGDADPTWVRTLTADLVPQPGRAERRVSLLYLGHLSDPQLADTMSPVRVEYVDPAAVGDYDFAAAWRPQEALAPRVFDAGVRALDARRTSRLRTAGPPRTMDLALVTGDLADSGQTNELALAVDVLRGGEVDPFSGRPVGPEAPCPEAGPEQVERLDRAVAARRYTGVQRYADWPAAVPLRRRVSFWDPDRAAPFDAGVRGYGDLPRHPGLMDRALRPFVAAGLSVPYRVARGNHDALAQGRYSEWFLQSVYRLGASGVAVDGCRKMFPNALVDPTRAPFDAGRLDRARETAILEAVLTMLARVREPGNALLVPGDPRRRYADAPAFRSAFSAAPQQGGYAYVDPSEARDSRGWALYYAWDPAPGLRLVSIDTNASGDDGAGDGGNLDDPQFRWLERTLAATPPGTLVVVFGHHPLESMDDLSPDEPPGPCPPGAVCDGDPRCSVPIHPGLSLAGVRRPASACGVPLPPGPPPRSLRDLLLDHPQVIAYVNGHTHVHRIEPFPRDPDAGGGFWQITTGSLAEWPQQGRTLEILDNRDGSLSILSFVFDALPPTSPPATGSDARGFDREQLLAVARRVAALDWEWREHAGREAAGRMRRVGGRTVNLDADVELLLPDPRP